MCFDLCKQYIRVFFPFSENIQGFSLILNAFPFPLSPLDAIVLIKLKLLRCLDLGFMFQKVGKKLLISECRTEPQAGDEMRIHLVRFPHQTQWSKIRQPKVQGCRTIAKPLILRILAAI
jgi:hypothetical protein